MKVVLDADVLVAAVRSRRGASAAWLRAGLRREVEMMASVPLMVHYESVILRPEHQAASALSAGQLGQLLDAIAAVATRITISYLWRPMLRDPDDELVLETAVNGNADLLLTFNEQDYAGAWSFAPIISRPGPAWRGRLEGSR
jgi:putative PIN family toxin of toxin-antitoxin system